MPCKDWKHDWVAQLYGELGPDEHDKLAEHLERCAECRTTMAELTSSRQLLLRSVPAVPAVPRVVVLKPKSVWPTTWAFVAGATMLALAAYTTELLPLCASVIVFFMCGTALTATISGVAGIQGGRRYARFVSASDLGSAAGPLFGWLAIGTLDAENFAIVLAAAMYGLATIVARFTFPKMNR